MWPWQDSGQDSLLWISSREEVESLLEAQMQITSISVASIWLCLACRKSFLVFFFSIWNCSFCVCSDCVCNDWITNVEYILIDSMLILVKGQMFSLCAWFSDVISNVSTHKCNVCCTDEGSWTNSHFNCALSLTSFDNFYCTNPLISKLITCVWERDALSTCSYCVWVSEKVREQHSKLLYLKNNESVIISVGGLKHRGNALEGNVVVQAVTDYHPTERLLINRSS